MTNGFKGLLDNHRLFGPTRSHNGGKLGETLLESFSTIEALNLYPFLSYEVDHQTAAHV